jgi:hypothetical protein
MLSNVCPPRNGVVCNRIVHAMRADHVMGLSKLRDIRTAGNGAQGRGRTADTAIFSRMLYQLSYLGTGTLEACL